MYRKYLVYLDDGKNVFKVAIPAVCEEAAINLCGGNGEVVAIKDVTDDYPIDREKVFDALKNAGFGRYEIDLMCRALSEIEIIS